MQPISDVINQVILACNGQGDAPEGWENIVAEFRRQYQTAQEFAKSDDADKRYRAFLLHKNLDGIRKLLEKEMKNGRV